jgi:hypothetical protein
MLLPTYSVIRDKRNGYWSYRIHGMMGYPTLHISFAVTMIPAFVWYFNRGTGSREWMGDWSDDSDKWTK